MLRLSPWAAHSARCGSDSARKARSLTIGRRANLWKPVERKPDEPKQPVPATGKPLPVTPTKLADDAEIDRTGFYRGHAAKEARSRMNVPFRLPKEELEDRFVKEAKAAGMDGLKGHRSVGGLRASIYNAFPEEGIDALVAFMQEFEKKNG